MDGGIEVFTDNLPYIIPMLVLEIVLLVIAIIDLDRRQYVTGNSKLIWVFIIVIIGIIGPVIYFVFGRKKRMAEDRKE